MFNVYCTLYIALNTSKIKLEKIKPQSSRKKHGRQGPVVTKNSKNKFNYTKIKGKCNVCKESYNKSVRNKQQPNRKIGK